MPPKQDSNMDRITALEGHLGGLTSLIKDIRAEMKANHQRTLEMEQRAEERHRESKEEKSQAVAAVATTNPGNPKSTKGSADETQPQISDVPQPQAKGVQMRPEHEILQLPETAVPLRSTEIQSTPFTAGSTGFSALQKSSPPQKKLELPEFAGKNPDDWIFRMEKCFSVNHTGEDEKLSLAMACMVGCAVTWLRMIQVRDELLDWRGFKMKLKKRFKPTRGGTILSQMLRLRQSGSISEYREAFEELSAEVPHVPDDVLEEIFLHGMKRSLREQVVRLRPTGMDEIVDMAKIIEEQENEKNTYHSRNFQRTNSAPTLNNHQRQFNTSPVKTGEVTPARKYFESQRDNKQSDQKKTVQNPCRHCGERFFAGHRCKAFQRFICMDVEEESEQEEDEEEESEGPLGQQNQNHQELQVLSLWSMVGITSKRNLKVLGQIRNENVVVLINSGASCNFIGKAVMQALGLPVQSTQEFGVSIVLQGQGKCSGVEMNIQGVKIEEEYLLFELGTIDVVLGYSWLSKLGETRINWGLHTMRF